MNPHPATAIDAAPIRRPGVPEYKKPEPMGSAHWLEPERQAQQPGVLKDRRQEFRATFGTGQRPAGLSGVLRRFAYDMPDYESKRWAVLMLADRVDTLEGRLVELGKSPVAWGAAAVGALGALGLWRAVRS